MTVETLLSVTCSHCRTGMKPLIVRGINNDLCAEACGCGQGRKRGNRYLELEMWLESASLDPGLKRSHLLDTTSRFDNQSDAVTVARISQPGAEDGVELISEPHSVVHAGCSFGM